jgi:hypothetical protein
MAQGVEGSGGGGAPAAAAALLRRWGSCAMLLCLGKDRDKGQAKF